MSMTLARASKVAGTNYPKLTDPAVIEAAEAYVAAANAATQADKVKEALKPTLREALGEAPKAQAGAYVLSMSEVAPSPPKLAPVGSPTDPWDIVITPDMVGKIIRGKAGSVRLLVKAAG